MKYAAFIPLLVGALLSSCKTDDGPVPLGFGDVISFPTHRQLEVGWESSDGAIMSGTLYLPAEEGTYKAVIWHFGSNKWSRILFPGSALNRWLAEGIAVLSYDKRGVGKSQGSCCPWQDPDYFPLLGDDVLSGVRAIASHPEIDATKIGAFGFSQGGWVLPAAAAESEGDIAFTIIGSGPTVTLGEELLYSKLTGENQCVRSSLSIAEIDQRLTEVGPSLFDPIPYLERMENPGLWIFGEDDLSVPIKQSVAILDRLVDQNDKEFSHITIPEANHSWVVNGGLCGKGTPEDMLPDIFAWINERF